MAASCDLLGMMRMREIRHVPCDYAAIAGVDP